MITGYFSPHVLAEGARARACWTCAHLNGRFFGGHVMCEYRGGVQVIGSPELGCCSWQRESGADAIEGNTMGQGGGSGIGGLVLIGLIGYGIYSCTKEDDRWSAYVYPHRSNLSVHEFAGDFPNLETCRVAALGRLNVITDGNPSRGDYECGLNCMPDSRMGGLNVCKETAR